MERYFDREGFDGALASRKVEWRRHAIERLLSRGYRRLEVLAGLRNSTVIEEYPSDQPYPSALFLGFAGNRPFHAVAAFDGEKVYIITIYEPDPEHFEPDLRTRIKP